MVWRTVTWNVIKTLLPYGAIFLLSIQTLLAEEPVQPWIDGVSSSITVKGALVESTCVLDMASADQTITLSDIPKYELYQFGQDGQAIPFQLKLRDCGSTGNTVRDPNHGNNLTWLPDQQAVFFTFYSEQQRNGLIKPIGNAQGIALRLEDRLHRSIALGQKSYLQILNQGDNNLVFYVIPQRTNEPLMPGAFSAVVNFQLTYE